jgi:Protein of unknown function (DUF3631)
MMATRTKRHGLSLCSATCATSSARPTTSRPPNWSRRSLVKALAEIEGRPWCEYGKTGKPISQNALDRLLKRTSVAPQQIGPEGARVRGYVRAHFEDAFARYLATEGDHNRPSVQNPAKSGTF